MYNNGFLRVAVVTPEVKVAEPMENAKEMLKTLAETKAGLVLYPELSITGYNCEDLFYHDFVINKSKEAIEYFLSKNTFEGVVVFGAPLEHRGVLYNVAFAVQGKKILGIVPKMFLPHTGEFYEKRWFADGVGIDEDIEFLNQIVPFGSIVFNSENYSFGIEVCADMWGALNPSANLYLSGAHIVLNLSASNEVINKSKLRKQLINTTTFRHKGAYVYCSAGVNESTGANVFGGDKIVSELGETIASMQNYSFEKEVLYADIDISYLKFARRSNGWYKDGSIRTDGNVIDVDFVSKNTTFELIREFDPLPFVPKKDEMDVFNQVTSIQTSSLIRRIRHLDCSLIIGLSGGLDSTLAFLQAVKAYQRMNWKLSDIHVVMMPSYPTSERTMNNAKELSKKFSVTVHELPIHDFVDAQMNLLNHHQEDITYENIQARVRTNILMNMANKFKGIVLGTGDMSEIALGWCTFAGDATAHYGINSGLPKTLVKFMVSKYREVLPELKEVLTDVLETPISPELLPNQISEETVGSYEINDFIMYRFLKYGDSAERIKTFIPSHKKLVDGFFKRFNKAQFKRNAMPEGVKVVFTSLNSHSDFRMASDILK